MSTSLHSHADAAPRRPGGRPEQQRTDVRAHVLLQMDPGRSAEAVGYLSGVPAVVDAVQISGSYDVILTLQAESEEALQRAMALAKRIPGLCAMRVCRPACRW